MINFRRLNVLLSLLIGVVMLVIWQIPDGKLHLFFCDVGQGDSILLEYKNYQILVDGGPDNSVLACLGKHMPFWDRKIELIFLTHPESDHLTGLIEVVKRYRVGKLIKTRVKNLTPEFQALNKVILKRKISTKELTAGNMVKIGNLNLKILWPVKSIAKEYEDCQIKASGCHLGFNRLATVILGQYGQFKFLLTGDISETEETEIIAMNSLTSVQVLKIAHHGSKFSSSVNFLEILKPNLAVIEVGKNKFGHPSVQVLERLKKVKAQVMRTDLNGTIEVVSDGYQWSLK